MKGKRGFLKSRILPPFGLLTTFLIFLFPSFLSFLSSFLLLFCLPQFFSHFSSFFPFVFGQRPRRGPEGTLVLCNRGNFVCPSVRLSVCPSPPLTGPQGPLAKPPRLQTRLPRPQTRLLRPQNRLPRPQNRPLRHQIRPLQP